MLPLISLCFNRINTAMPRGARLDRVRLHDSVDCQNNRHASAPAAISEYMRYYLSLCPLPDGWVSRPWMWAKVVCSGCRAGGRRCSVRPTMSELCGPPHCGLRRECLVLLLSLLAACSGGPWGDTYFKKGV